MTEYRVAYEAHFEADSPREAALKLAELLTRPGVPERGLYEVTDTSASDIFDIDLGEGQW